ncbi:class I SAM-dependent methyltransferase [Nocardiopsis alba]|jgi:SAM-dependent methyltransferase|uniref:class I SAM-dependent methyltransferase n=1 Tax=Nocardiopsis alba TaxID=53437 RepID=UPI00339DE7F2
MSTAPYDGYAEAFAAAAEDNAYNAHYDRPTVLSLMGDVRGLSVLDAGCGPGLYSRELVARGARVTGLDQSADMVRVAREHLGGDAEILQRDLATPLDLPASSFDAALIALVVHYLPDRVATLRELRRVLRPDGFLVLSTSHPTADWIRDGGGYFEERHVDDRWDCGLLSRFWRQPLERWFDEFRAAGLWVDRLVETRPRESMRERHPEEYELLSGQPGFITFRLVRG